MAAEKFFPFRSVSGDRKYSAEDWAAYFALFLSDGVFYSSADKLKVVANEGMKVKIGKGAGFIAGRMYMLETDKTITLDTADGVMSRIDRIVLRCDYTNRKISTEVKKGSYSANPTAPELTRDADIYELALADIYVAAGVVTITTSNITDLRLNTALCGIVTGLVEQADTQAIFDEFYAYLQEFKQTTAIDFKNWTAEQQKAYSDWYTEQEKAFTEWYNSNTTGWENDFKNWFEEVQSMLEGDIAVEITQRVLKLENGTTQAGDAKKLGGKLPEHYAPAESVGECEKLNTEDKTSVVNAINELLANMGNLNTLSTKQKDSLVKALNEVVGKLRNDNLLKNSNFKLNTNGLSEYAGIEIEGANTWYVNGGMIVGENGVIIQTATWVYQVVESLKNQTMTATVELSDGTILTGTAKTDDLSVDNTYGMGGNDKFLFYLQYWKSFEQLRFIVNVTGQSNISINHVKLELGSLATEYVEPDIEIEKVRCGLGLTKGSAVVLNEISGISAGFETFMDETNGNFYFCITKWMPNGVFRRYQIEPNIHNIDIFEWDGSTWSKLGAIGSGITHLGNQVYALGTVDNSEMYVNGAMKTIDIRVPIVNYGAVEAPIEINAPTNIQGNVRINKANPVMDLLSTSTGRASRIQHADTSGSAGLVNYKDSSNYTAIWLSGESSALSNMLRMVSIKNGVSNTYPILHTGNSKPVAISSTAPSDTTSLWAW